MTEKKFKLDKNLEGLIQATMQSERLFEGISNNPNPGSKENIGLRFEASQYYQDNAILAFDPAPLYLELKLRRDNSYSQLQEEVKDDKKFEEIKSGLMSGLDENLKVSYYASLIKEGIVPKGPSEDLKKVLGAISFGIELQELVGSGSESDLRKAVDLVEEKINENYARGRLSIRSLYAGPVFRDSERQIIAEIANNQLKMGFGLMKEKNLYSEIDKAVLENPEGKAKALIGMYGVYQAQQKINKEKKSK